MMKKSNDNEAKITNILYDGRALKVIALACISIALSVAIMGGLSYNIAQQAVLKKLKSQDLFYIAEAISEKIDSRLQRAQETAVLLAHDPTILKWVDSREEDLSLRELSLSKIGTTVSNQDYANSFIINAHNKNYWDEKGNLIDVLSTEDPDDEWFFQVLEKKEAVSFSIDYNNERKDTYVFVNALMGDVNKPKGITGVGLSLRDISEMFTKYKFGSHSRLWLIDKGGTIHLSEDVEDRGKAIDDFIPADIGEELTGDFGLASETKVLQFDNSQGEIIDLISKPLSSTGWTLVLQIPRYESTGFLKSIGINTTLASIVSILLIVLIFFIASRRMADPLKTALALKSELERQVEERTRQLTVQNQKIMDSIEYAQRLQASIIPSNEKMEQAFPEFFVIWQPRDLVGGDFYWLGYKEGYVILAVADCTGHGVPGALMTMTGASVLKHIVDEVCYDNPAEILSELNNRMKAVLHNRSHQGISDDGIDIGIVVKKGYEISFSGAKIPLFVKTAGGLEIIPGDRHSIGYNRSDNDLKFDEVKRTMQKGDRIYLTSDGFLDQNGGDKDYQLGRKRFTELILENSTLTLNEQKERFLEAFTDYSGENDQRDDITVLAIEL